MPEKKDDDALARLSVFPGLRGPDRAASMPATASFLAGSGATDPAALAEMLPRVYEELRELAAGFLRTERPDHTLQPTALVHEAYLRLIGQHSVDWSNRAHFLGVAAQMMRRILATHAAARASSKRGGGMPRLALDAALDVFEQRAISVAALDIALKDLETIDPRQGKIVELRFFGGLTVEETAQVLSISPATVKREWAAAKRWLQREMAATKE